MIAMKKENESQEIDKNSITRKEAIQKAGKYAAFTAVSMMLLMSPVDSAATQRSIKKPKKH